MTSPLIPRSSTGRQADIRVSETTEERQAPPLFQFLALLGVALVRKKITGQQAGIALLVALTSHGTTGERAIIDAEMLATESGLSIRQVWRHFTKLTELGWFVQTELPRRSAPGQQARRARYRLTLPSLDLSLGTSLDRVTLAGGYASHETGDLTEPSDTFAVQRVTLSDQPCDTAEREDGTVSPSHGSTSHGSPTSGHSTTSTTGPARERSEITPVLGDLGRCRHGINGGRRIIGAADDASRICVDCEAEAPGADARRIQAELEATTRSERAS
jgi:hypothetical protein